LRDVAEGTHGSERFGDRFRIWVDEKISERNEKIMQTQNLAINMDPEIYAAF